MSTIFTADLIDRIAKRMQEELRWNDCRDTSDYVFALQGALVEHEVLTSEQSGAINNHRREAARLRDEEYTRQRAAQTEQNQSVLAAMSFDQQVAAALKSMRYRNVSQLRDDGHSNEAIAAAVARFES